MAGAYYDWGAIRNKIKSGGKLWDEGDEKVIANIEKQQKQFSEANKGRIIGGNVAGSPDLVSSGKPFSRAYTRPETFGTGMSSSNPFNIAASFGEAEQNTKYKDLMKSTYTKDITDRYTKISNYDPKITIVKQDTEAGKLSNMDKFSNQTLGVFGNIQNLKHPKTVYQYKNGDLQDPVSGNKLETVFENILQLQVVAEDKNFYYYKTKANASGTGSIQSVRKEYVQDQLPDLQEQKLKYMEAQVKNKQNVATMAEKINFNVGEGMRRLAMGSETKAQVDTGNNIVNKVTDIGGEILGFGVPTGAGMSLASGLEKTGSKIVSGIANKAPGFISKQLTGGIGKAVATGATEMGIYSGLENTESKKNTDKVKSVLENMFAGAVFGAGAYGLGKGASKLIQAWKKVPDTPETLNLIEAAKNEYLNSYDEALRSNTLPEQSKLANEAGDKLLENVNKISNKYEGDKSVLMDETGNPISSNEGKILDKNGNPISSNLDNISKPSSTILDETGNPISSNKLPETQKPSNILSSKGEPLPSSTEIPSSKIDNTVAKNRITELESKLSNLQDTTKTAPSKEVDTEVASIKKEINDLNLQLFGGGNPPPSNGVNPNVLKTGEHIISKSDTAKTTLRQKFDAFYRQVVDRNRRLQTVSEVAGKGKSLVAESPYKMSNIASSYEGIAKSNIEQGISDKTGKVVGEGLGSIMKSVPKNKAVDMKDYLILRQASHLMETQPEKGQVYPKEWGLKVEDMKAKLKVLEANNPTFKNIATRYTNYNEKLTRTQLVDSGLLSPEEYQRMKLVNPFYAPNKRAMLDVEAGKSFGTKAGYTGQGKQVKSRIGSERQIIDPFESTIENTFNYAKAAKRNEVGQTLYKLALKEPEKLKPFLEVVKKAPDKNLSTRIQEGDLSGFVDDINAGFEIKGVKDLSKPNVVRIRIKGKDAYMKVNDATLLDNLTYLNTDQINSFVETTRKLTGGMKALTTGVNPVFGVGRNIWRDVVTGYVQSKTTSKIPVANYALYLKDLVGSGIGSILKTKNYKEYRALGGGFFSSAVGTEKNLLKETVQKYTERGLKGKTKRLVKSPITAMEWLNNTLETMPRYAEYQRTLKKMAKQGVDEYSAKLEGVYNGQEVTVNFQRSGEFTKGADAFVPYLNAAVQGLDKTLRMLNPKDPAQLANVISKGVTSITVPALMLYALNHDNKDYQQMSDYIKDNNFLIPVSLASIILPEKIIGDKNVFEEKNKSIFIKIPKPREFGVLFGSLPERIARMYADKDPKAFKNFMETVKTNFEPPNILLDNMAAPIIRNVMSKEGSTWRGTPVVGAALLQESPKNQYDENTSAIAKFIGSKLNFAPKKVDEIMKSYLGGAAQIGIPATSKRALNEKGVIKTAIEVLKKQVTSDSKYQTDIANNFYTNMENVNMKKADMKSAGQLKGKSETYVDSATYNFNKISQNVSDLRAEQKAAKTNEEKDKIQIKMNNLMQKANDDYKKNYLKKNNMETVKRSKAFTRSD
jgi:hypothetical protein